MDEEGRTRGLFFERGKRGRADENPKRNERCAVSGFSGAERRPDREERGTERGEDGDRQPPPGRISARERGGRRAAKSAKRLMKPPPPYKAEADLRLLLKRGTRLDFFFAAMVEY